MSECTGDSDVQGFDPLPDEESAALVNLFTRDPVLDPFLPFDGTPHMPSVLPANPAEPADDYPDAEPVLVDYVSSDASTVVADLLRSTGDLANSAQYAALNNLDTLASYAPTFALLTAPDVPLPNQVVLPPLGEVPQPGDLVPAFASAPDAPVLATPALVEVGDPPAYDVTDIAIMDIALPDPFDALLPTEPVFDPVGVAVMPDVTLPELPTLLELAVPDAPVVELPLFDAVLGTGPTVPTVVFSYAEVEYDSALLSAMQARITTLVSGIAATGIAAEVEQAIWDRAADREALLTHRAIGEALRLMKMRGFHMPEAALVRIVQQALQGGIKRDASLRREIAIEQARLQQANYRFALETAIALESRMLDKANAAQARSLEAAKASVQAEIAIFNARVQLFSADVQAFAMKATAFRARLEAVLAVIAVYRAQLEAQRTIGAINTQKVAIYKAQVAAVSFIVDMYKTQVEAAKEQIDANKSFVEAYRARIDAFKAQVEAKNYDYDNYAARVRGQATRADLFEQQVRSYKGRVSAFSELVKAKVAVQTLRYQQASGFPLELYKTEIEAYRIGSMASIEQVRATAAVFSSRVKAFSAQEGAKAGHLDAQARIAAANAGATIAKAESLIQSGRDNLQLVEGAVATAQANLRSCGQLAGQLSAAAIAAQCVLASIADGGSRSVSNSASDSSSNGDSHSTNTSNGSSSSTNTTYSASTGISVSNSKSTAEGRSFSRGISTNFSDRRSAHNNTSRSTHNSYLGSASFAEHNNVSTNCTDSTVISD